MTNSVASDSFDTLLNSYATKAAMGNQEGIADLRLDEYEKTVFLNKAQETLVISLYNGRNPSGNSFEKTEELRRYLAPLVEESVLEPISNSAGIPLGDSSKHKFFTLPNNPAVWFIVFEEVTINDTSKPCFNADNKPVMEVVPVRHDEYNRLKKNPFRGANNRRALRLDLSEDNIEIVCKYEVESYHLRYLRKPVDIDLVDGDEDAEFSELPDSLHQRILEIAVEMALHSKGLIKNENK